MTALRKLRVEPLPAPVEPGFDDGDGGGGDGGGGPLVVLLAVLMVGILVFCGGVLAFSAAALLSD